MLARVWDNIKSADGMYLYSVVYDKEGGIEADVPGIFVRPAETAELKEQSFPICKHRYKQFWNMSQARKTFYGDGDTYLLVKTEHERCSGRITANNSSE